MNGIKYLLDTCFIIEFYNGNKQVLDIIQAKQIELTECVISPINRMEVLGFSQLSKDDENNLNWLLDSLKSLPINRAIENKAIDLRQRHKIKLPDCIVLATALNYQIQLLSLDDGLMNKYYKELNHDN
ncbi:PIN domain-containing protein [Moraxella nasovis]|uniref:PIN domain-containing protein n=1 Tax=Moraxella nasovis TaxID=2904121 RepID=UPI001F60E80F|nr:PIN domain-containing protein [Moraxella nasovis]UNU74231.1 PIN domain-containing protein [Moraxella nasovis]